MATVVGQASAAATSVAIPAHAVGDLIIVAARGTAAAPVKPAAGGTVPAWDTLQSAIANSIGLTTVAFVATATNHTTGTFTSATHICVLVLRPGALKKLQTAAARSSTGNGNNTQTIIYPALTLNNGGGASTSLGVRIGTRTVADSEVGTNVPASWTNQSIQPAGAGALMAVHTRLTLPANPTADSIATAGSNAAYRAHTVEVEELPLGSTIAFAATIDEAADVSAQANPIRGLVASIVEAAALVVDWTVGRPPVEFAIDIAGNQPYAGEHLAGEFLAGQEPVLVVDLTTSLIAMKAGTDAAGASTENALVSATAAATDIDGVHTEAVAQVAAIPVADVDGVHSDLVTMTGSIPVADVDGVHTESVSTLVSPTATDLDGPEVESGLVSAATVATDIDGVHVENVSQTAAIPVVDTDGPETESGSLIASAIILGSDSDGPETEIATPLVGLAGTDADGAGNEIAATSASPFAVSDLGTHADSGALAAGIPVADVDGANLEAAAYTYPLAVNDADGNHIEVGSPGVGVAGADASGNAADLASALYNALSSDLSVTVLEVGSTQTLNFKNGSDLGAALEAAALTAALAASDAISPITELGDIRFLVASSDIDGTHTDNAVLTQVALVVTDSDGPESETGSFIVGIVVADAGTIGEVGLIAGMATLVTAADVGTIFEVAAPFFTTSVSDVIGPRTEVAAALATFLAVDAGSSIETYILTAANLVLDTAAGSDTAARAAAASATDASGATVENAKMGANVTDSGLSVDAIKSLTAALSAQDQAAFDEFVNLIFGHVAFDISGGTIEIGYMSRGEVLAMIETGRIVGPQEGFIVEDDTATSGRIHGPMEGRIVLATPGEIVGPEEDA